MCRSCSREASAINASCIIYNSHKLLEYDWGCRMEETSRNYRTVNSSFSQFSHTLMISYLSSLCHTLMISYLSSLCHHRPIAHVHVDPATYCGMLRAKPGHHSIRVWAHERAVQNIPSHGRQPWEDAHGKRSGSPMALITGIQGSYIRS
jgi:hypothetical protein